MPYSALRIRPGMDLEQSSALNEGGWESGNLIRWFGGLPQPVGGWQHLTTTALIGTCRKLHEWADLLGNPYMACGTNERLELYIGGALVDITPLRKTSNISPDFTTVISTTSVTVTDVANGVAVGDWINIVVPVSIGGIILQGFYKVITVVDPNNFTITSASAATSSVANAGAVPLYTTVMSSANVTVTLANHGYSSSNLYTNQVATTVGGVTLAAYSVYAISSITDANNFVIVASMAASSSTTGSENGGNSQIQYLIGSGNAFNVSLSGYGAGPYGAGPYGISNPAVSYVSPMRLWSLDNFGQDLVGSYTDSPLYFWVPPYTAGSVAQPVTGTDVPQIITSCFVTAPQQMIIALGTDPVGGGAKDPNLVRWCDVGDFTDWLPTPANQAGSYRIPSGSMIVGGLHSAQYTVVWTDIDMYLMQYLGAPLVWGFTQVASACGLVSQNAAGVYESLTLWMSDSNFFMYDGNSVRIIDCPVWDYVFGHINNLDKTQLGAITCAINSYFDEATWYFPTTTFGGVTPDDDVMRYVTYDIRENLWSVGTLTRTAWNDANVLGAPVGVDENGIIMQHETTTTADGMVLPATITSGQISIAEGTEMTFVERIIMDFIVQQYGISPTTNITVQVQITTYDIMDQVSGTFSYTWNSVQTTSPTPANAFAVARVRGRTISFTINTLNQTGGFWRLGNIRGNMSPAGGR